MLELPTPSKFKSSTTNTLAITMFARARWRCLECNLKRHSQVSEAAPLLRIASKFQSRNFSATPIPNSKIGKAPLSIPPGVIFEVIPPVIGKRKRNIALQKQLLPTVHIKGPLGVHLCYRRSRFVRLTKDVQERYQWRFQNSYPSIVPLLKALLS